MTEDDDLGIDLDAWQAPPPPAGIADGVLARMREQQGTQVTVSPVEPERSKAPWLVGGIAAAAGIVAIVAFGIKRAPANGHGIVTADKPMQLALDSSSAELDPGARVEWQRQRHALTANQTGTATWHVHDGDSLTIRIPSVDAAVASVDARDANLRVEVQMDPKKTIALSAGTSAAVALVTVVVFNGTVKVTSADTTQQVSAGSAITIKAKGENVISQEMAVGASPDTQKLLAELAEKQKLIEKLQAYVDAANTAPVKDACDEVSCVLNNYEGKCCQQFRIPDSLTREHISVGMAALKTKIDECGIRLNGKVTARVTVDADGSVASVDVKTPNDAAPSLGSEVSAKCMEDVIRGATFRETRSGGTFTYPFVFHSSCADADESFSKGMDAFSSGSPAEALPLFEKAFACKHDDNTRKFVFASACKAHDLNKARQYWRQMTQSMKDSMAMFCVSNMVTIDDLNGGSPAAEKTDDKVATTGKLLIMSKPWATVLVDGKEVGTTPIDTTLAPGRHKVTFVIGDAKHTFVVTIKAGETVRMVKDFE